MGEASWTRQVAGPEASPSPSSPSAGKATPVGACVNSWPLAWPLKIPHSIAQLVICSVPQPANQLTSQ